MRAENTWGCNMEPTFVKNLLEEMKELERTIEAVHGKRHACAAMFFLNVHNAFALLLSRAGGDAIVNAFMEPVIEDTLRRCVVMAYADDTKSVEWNEQAIDKGTVYLMRDVKTLIDKQDEYRQGKGQK